MIGKNKEKILKIQKAELTRRQREKNKTYGGTPNEEGR